MTGAQAVNLRLYFLKVPLTNQDGLVYRINDAILTASLNVFLLRTHLRNFTVITGRLLIDAEPRKEELRVTFNRFSKVLRQKAVSVVYVLLHSSSGQFEYQTR